MNQQGQTHTKRKKSHFGCLSCKSRKIKCDETKPICRRCQLQNLNCIYSKEWSRSKKTPPGLTPENSSPTSFVTTHASSPISQVTFINDAFSSTEPITDIPVSIEVKLIYQWTVFTSNSFGSYGDYFQKCIPEKAFNYRLLFDAMLLLSAAHIYHTKPSEDIRQAVEIYKFRTIAGVRKEIESGLHESQPREELAWSSAFLALFWLTCDTDTEFSGLSYGWRPLFRGMGDIFHKIVTSDIVPEVLKHARTFKLSLPSGEKYLPRLQEIYKDRLGSSKSEDIKVYEQTALKLAQNVEKIVNEPNQSSVQCVSYWILTAMPDPFIQQINDFDPVALTFLATFFALISSLPCWYLGVYSWKHHLRIKAKIPVEMHHFLDLSYLGLNPPFNSATDPDNP